ncbi:MAG: FtsQ-type POTRA domain-containing protein [Firmicutes bacterium]|jgi:cell division septal protein FtsQ|nr:FtsQ-type POTRA domain-containing protein [Bacillota bacterium]
MREERMRKRKRKLNKKRFAILLAILFVIVSIIIYAFNIRVTNIKIIGTNRITDNEIIEITNLKNYPKLFKYPIFKIANDVKKIDLVDKVKVSKNVYGRVTINVSEAKILFYNKTTDKVVLSNSKEVEYKPSYLGIPTLINYVPTNIYEDLIKGLSLIDEDIIAMISEIEYSPSKTANGETIDDYRFLLRMNDSNTVYMNTVNIKKLNKYLEITATILNTNEETSGILYLDSSIGDSFSFESYASIVREQERQKAEQEKAEKEKEEQEKRDAHNEN